MFAPRVTPRSKVVTSGRLTGAVGAPAHRTRGTLKSRPEVAYSLYSTDSEDQVATLHKGLDRCAALLSDILQSDNAGAVPKKDKAVKDGTAKCRPHTLTGKKAIRRSVTKSSTKTPGIIPQRSTVTPQRSTATPQRSIATPHSGVKLHPPARKHHLLKNLSKSCSPLATLNCVPVRDQGLIGVSSDEGPETEGKMKRVQCLLEELRTLMAGQGDTAQTYLCLLEQTVSSALNTDVNKNPAQSTTKNQTDRTELQMLQSHNTQLQRQVKVLNQQLQDQEASQQLLNSQVLSLQGQLRTSEKELTQVQKILQETQRRLQNKEEETVCLKTELESTRGRLRVTLQDKFKLEGTVQQKQQEIEELQRVIDQYDSSTPTLENQVYPPGAAKEHITQYLLSLEQNRPTHPDESLDLPLCSSLRAPGPDQVPERDVDSVISDWSIQSDSTFNTRDESAFRDGLAALDASIASLQKTLKMDLVKT